MRSLRKWLPCICWIALSIAACEGSKARVVRGDVYGNVLDGQTGLPLSGATVFATDDAANTQTTDGSGNYSFLKILAKDHVFHADLAGYSSEDLNVRLPRDTALHGVNFVLLPLGYLANKVVIVLTWGDHPTDLDSHLYVPNGDPYYEISYMNLGDITANPFASLDVDDTDGFGPETTAAAMSGGNPHYAGVYRFYVMNYTEFSVTPYDPANDLANSGAQVKVYVNAVLTKTYNVPTRAGQGGYWHVFDLNGTVFTDVNQLMNAPPPEPP